MHQNLNPMSGIGYFFSGFKIAMQPGLRRYVFMPLLINIILVGGALFYLFSHLNQWIEHWIGALPEFLSWLSYILWPLLALTILATFSYFFSTLANFIAAPFNGLLAEKVEQQLSPEGMIDQSVAELIKDVPRILAREWRKIVYLLPKAIGLFLLLLIPAFGQTVAPFVWFIFTSWMLAIQYCDYPFDNHKVDFNSMRFALKAKQGKAYGYGAMVTIFTSIPLLNLIIMPVAVCGATLMWVTEFKQHQKVSY
ncbi:sulfate transporter CysZ [Vibrio sp. UCD-FRSSP16_10]|uniref:sulfate transporter CysZ n=1 Tax=unclassified Vibrio TaxID=2614977 RepID=UPI0007FB73E8|nr:MULTISPECIES: sulfate transporter CysZ [unclassified Vibrio]OBT08623.1 sulfate transporter CysZ [Vibrio sp. UCD-FRSSP16_30]OBT18153.1 sulfate transporter CysZ [Vibrio sp. UCD-FRSSP16_10]